MTISMGIHKVLIRIYSYKIYCIYTLNIVQIYKQIFGVVVAEFNFKWEDLSLIARVDIVRRT